VVQLPFCPRFPAVPDYDLLHGAGPGKFFLSMEPLKGLKEHSLRPHGKSRPIVAHKQRLFPLYFRSTDLNHRDLGPADRSQLVLMLSPKKCRLCSGIVHSCRHKVLGPDGNAGQGA
jgi:hypothetical protein